MHYATASILSIQNQIQLEGESCSYCNDDMEPQANFCRSCGYVVAPSSFNVSQFPLQAPLIDLQDADFELSSDEIMELSVFPVLPLPQPAMSVPEFATMQSMGDCSSIVSELNAEGREITVLLAREKVFLGFLLSTFLTINLFGCWAAWTCYTGFSGDEMTKMVMATTPFLFINLGALVVLVPIKGTQATISMLKQRLNHNRFKLEFADLNLSE